MSTIEASIQDSDLLWTNFEQLEPAYINSFKIHLLAASAPLLEAGTALMYGPSAFGWLVIKTSGISAIALYILFVTNVALLQNHQFFKNRLVKVIGTGVALLITVVAIYYLKSFAILPIFQGMCHYSAYLQLKGLTREQAEQLKLEDTIKHIVSTNTAINISRIYLGYIYKTKHLKDYLQIFFLPSLYIHQHVFELLNLAYLHRKILTFYTVTLFNKYIVINSQNTKYKCFEICVDYLIRCKKLHPDLDEAFLNTQLKYLVIHFPSPLSIINEIPVINQLGNELGDISQLKQKLIDCFGSVIETN